ncbi:MAG: DNA topoisomerase VI subunit B [Acidilobaceae archaeon]|nr:DNA topoisomerase VI subunit B [Acidilobaceae archaeon]MCX8165667.1 DNA topoisomerase VI subunit B [Acidilobaceae archaeon]MDW7974092.1 DNA topoisomerase VI subunit B [Sulfolobales archaeon]
MSNAESYRGMNVSEFFAKHKEVAGFANPTRAIYQTIRELVENSLDAIDGSEEGRKTIKPHIKVVVEKVEASGRGNEEKTWCKVTVEDNGIGVPYTVMPNAFAKVLFSSKYVLKQARGMYGIGVKAAVLYAQSTTDSGIDVVSSTALLEDVYSRKLRIDTLNNEPIINAYGSWKKPTAWRGTRVSLVIECDWARARSKVLEYMARTALIAPYVQITFQTPEKELYIFPQKTSTIPPPPKEANPHPHGIDVETLKQMLAATKAKTFREFLERDFQSVGKKSSLYFIRELKKKVKEIKEDTPPAEVYQKFNGLLSTIVDMMKTFKFKPPQSNYLSPLGEELIVTSLKSMYKPEWAAAIRRPPRSYQGHPFIVELGMAYGGEIQPSEEPLLLRFANKIPLLYEVGEDVSYKIMKEIDWRQYKVEFPAPLVILVHVVSTKIPYKGVGKESISEVPEVEQEIRNGMLELGRRLREYISSKEREEEVKTKILAVSKYLPEIARSLVVLSKEPHSWKPPKPGEEKEVLLGLIKLVSSHVKLPEKESSEEVIRKILGVKKSGQG